jgi:hypothetical protein
MRDAHGPGVREAKATISTVLIGIHHRVVISRDEWPARLEL